MCIYFHLLKNKERQSSLLVPIPITQSGQGGSLESPARTAGTQVLGPPCVPLLDALAGPQTGGGAGRTGMSAPPSDAGIPCSDLTSCATASAP